MCKHSNKIECVLCNENTECKVLLLCVCKNGFNHRCGAALLQVTVSDNGSPPLSSTTRVVVIVDDVNDNAPQFEQSFYHIVIPETQHHDSAVIQVVKHSLGTETNK